MQTNGTMGTDDKNSLSPNKQALLKIRELKQQLAEAQEQSSSRLEPIAIVSMACRFPRTSSTPEAFWKCLIDQTDEVSEIPEDRWNLPAFHDDDPDVPGKMYARHGVFLDHLDLMDPEFFGISPREATWVDPQQRLLMEVGWEALERAGWTADRIGSETGVFVGWMHNDYQNEASDSFLNLNPYIATGAAGSFLCGRLAYYLGLEGPSIAVDTACSSSLVALHLACQSLLRRECDRALVGGVNAICSPTTNILTCKLKALSPSGHSRAFDAAADGYLRGEGCGVITIRRLADALQDDDPILGVIEGSAVGHNGFSSGLTAPNPRAQERVIRQALERASIRPEDVSYLEAHGTGTELGDPIELQAAAAALASSRSHDAPLLVGSVKTNIGHLEAAAGMAGLIKVLLAIQNDQIPGQLNFETPNPHIAWDKMAVEVLTKATAWPDSGRKVAGVSAFGMSGTNAHVVVSEPPHRASGQTSSPGQLKPVNQTAVAAAESPDVQNANTSELLTLSGKTEQAVQDAAETLASYLEANPDTSLTDIAYTTSVNRSHFEERLAVVADSVTEASSALRGLARSASVPGLHTGQAKNARKVAWQFTGQGSQYSGMGLRLYQSEATFRDAIDWCDDLMTEWRGMSLKSIMFDESDRIHDTTWTQPAIFAVQMGLAKLLESHGLVPDLVLGHSVGQYAAACVAGVMSWEDGLRLISERGRLIGQLPSGGSMLAVFGAVERIESTVGEHDGVSLAAFNGTHTVISGESDQIAQAANHFAETGIRTRALTTSHAFHSGLMEPALAEFAAVADSVSFSDPQIPLICNVEAKLIESHSDLTGEYWAAHIRQPVRYSQSVHLAQEIGCDVMVELGPAAVLTRMASADWKGQPDSLIATLGKDQEDRSAILNSLAALYVKGITPRFQELFNGRSAQHTVLPTYPFQRRRFWGPDKPRAAHAEFHTAHPLLGSRVSLAGLTGQKRFESFVEPDSPPWMNDHRVMGDTVLPGAAFVEMGLAAADGNALEGVAFEQPLRPTGRTAIQTIVGKDQSGQSLIESHSLGSDQDDWTRHFHCRVSDEPQTRPASPALDELEARCPIVVAPEDFYRKMSEVGLDYGPAFQTVRALQHSQTEVLARLSVSGDIRGYTVPPTLLDGALHCLAVGLVHEDDGNLYLPVGIDRVACHRAIEGEVWCHAVWHSTEGRQRSADVTLFSDDGQVLIELTGLQVQQVSRAALRKLSGTGSDRLMYEIQWTGFRLPASQVQGTRWLVIDAGHRSDDAVALCDSLNAQGHTASIAVLSSDSKTTSDHRLIAPTESDFQQLFRPTAEADGDGIPDGIAWLFSQPGGDIGPSESCQPDVSGLLALMRSIPQDGGQALRCGLQLLSSDAVSLGSDDASPGSHAAFWGLGRVIGAERPELRCRLIDTPALSGQSDGGESNESLLAVTELLLTETRENQLAVRDSQYHVPRLVHVPRTTLQAPGTVISSDHSYLVTGGLGMLGRAAGSWLASQGAGQVVLVSRREPDADTVAIIRQMEEQGCSVIVHSADVSKSDDIVAMLTKFGSEWKPLAGVLHAAGILDDALLVDQSWDRFQKVMAPKIDAAELLHKHTESMPLEFFVLYSSAASVLGSPGQGNYATANAALDGLAWRRRQAGLPATSINWGPWVAGMAADERVARRLALQGLTPLEVDEAHEVMDRLVTSGVTQATVIDADWNRMRLGLGAEPPALLDDLAVQKQKGSGGDSALVGQLRKLTGAARLDLLVSTIQGSLQNILSTPELPETDRPLIEMGLDSLMAVEFSTELQMMLGDQYPVAPTMLFEHPTIDAIAEHLHELIAEDGDGEPASADGTPPQSVETVEVRSLREPIAVIGMSCRLPGAHSVDEFWDNLLQGTDSVGEIPDDRWDIDRFYSAERAPGKMYTKEGGFLEDIGHFDAAFFNISDQEACWIDPQHRMLLENSYHALEDAGIPAHPLEDRNVGVFMGIMGQDYAFLPKLGDAEIIEAFQGAGLSHSAGVGRISYVFGFEGPSIAVDTASSSSLVALYQAVRSLQDGNCNMALAGGVNAILAPVNSLLMSKAGLLAPDGRCKSFSAEADGFGRGEGCGVVVLKRLSDAERDGDRILALVRGGSVVHNGFTGGITSPSGKSQARAISEALEDARIGPSQVQYLEAHGTGTEFGDPMEIGAAAGVYSKGRRRDAPLLVGSVKANISHLEAAGGVSGLIKTVLSLHHAVIPPQIHFDAPSPHVPWKRLPVRVVSEATDWPESDERIAGITALGLVGTNAHVILSSALSSPSDAAQAVPPDQPGEHTDGHTVGDFTSRPQQLLTISARSRTALIALLDRYANYLDANDAVSLEDVSYSASTGRRHYEHRVALLVDGSDRAVMSLNQIRDVVNETNDTVDSADSGPLHELADTNAAGDRSESRFAVYGAESTAPKVGWLIDGECSLSRQQARDLYQCEPLFREHIQTLDSRLQDWSREAGVELASMESVILDASLEDSHLVDDVHQYAALSGLAILWRSWGIEPDTVVGIGTGQYVAAALAGCVCFLDAGLMVAQLQHERATLEAAPESNGEHQAAALDRFEAFADQFNFYPPNLPLICSQSGNLIPVHQSLGGSYWRQHATTAAGAEAIVESLTASDVGCVLSLGNISVPTGEHMTTWTGRHLRSLDDNCHSVSTMQAILGEFYALGLLPDFRGLYSKREPSRIRLPLYPFQKRRYWITEIAEHTAAETISTPAND